MHFFILQSRSHSFFIENINKMEVKMEMKNNFVLLQKYPIHSINSIVEFKIFHFWRNTNEN